jgi:CRP/FNR family transcriptional regulator
MKKFMNREGLFMLHDAGIVRILHGKNIIYLSNPATKHVYFLKKGLVKISNIYNDKEEIIKYFVKPGNIFGELNLLDNEEDRNEVAVAVEDCEVCFIPVETAKQLMMTSPELQRSIHHSICNRVKKTEERLFSLTLKSVTERVLDFLKEFVKEFGHPVNGGFSAKNFLTHEDIARLTATSRQSVSKSLAWLKKTGFIEYDLKNLFVYNTRVTKG